MHERKDFWDKNAGRYDRFMRNDRAAYEKMYGLIRPVVKAKTVLEVSFEDFGKGLATCSRAASQSDDGTIVLTSSGFESEIFPPVPDGIDAEFHPLNSNPLKTLHRHSRRISKYGNFSLLDDTVFERINNAFEQKCRADGLINAPEDISESGLLTGRGAYLAWKAALRLRYFGM